jgi:hypothetical protein
MPCLRGETKASEAPGTNGERAMSFNPQLLKELIHDPNAAARSGA